MTYRANETQLWMPVLVTKNREIATRLVVQVTPMNVSAVIDAGLPLPASELPLENALEPNRATCEIIRCVQIVTFTAKIIQRKGIHDPARI